MSKIRIIVAFGLSRALTCPITHADLVHSSQPLYQACMSMHEKEK